MSIEKIPVKKIVEFRRLPKSRKITFVKNLKRVKKPISEGGGNYWVRSISAISKAFKDNDNDVIKDKIEEISELYEVINRVQTKSMYKRNIDILNNYIDFDFSKWRPSSNLRFLKKPNSILEMDGLPIQVLPQHIFSYGIKGNESIGAIWFVVWQEGFKSNELGIYSETLFRFLSSYYSKDYIINPSACIIVDIASMKYISYEDIIKGDVKSILDKTMNSLKEYL